MLTAHGLRLPRSATTPVRPLLVLIALVWLAGCTPSRLVLTEHPLVGRIWDVSQQRFVAPDEAESRIAAADIALLGEVHDNPAHHHIQARLLQRATDRGRRPALAMEQFDSEWQAAIDAARATSSTPISIAKAGHMSTGWEWPLYKPLVSWALRQQLPIVAANFSRPRTKAVVAGGLAALGSGEAQRLALDQPWTAGQNASMRELLVEGHCGEDSPMIDKLIPVQRTRDANMADAILARSADGTVAIVGRVHARNDIGVPLYLRRRVPEKRLLSLGLVEVLADRFSPADYPDAAAGIHDLVWFTPATTRSDPCVETPAVAVK